MPGGAHTLALVMLGGAIGAAGRFWLGGWLLRRAGDGVPWGTLAVNLAGSFAVGVLATWLDARGPAAAPWRALLVVGVLGALTTYSALMLECLLLMRDGRHAALLGYLALTLIGGLALVGLGAWLAQGLRTA